MVTYSDFFFFGRNYSDFVIFNFYEHYASIWIEMKNENYFIIQFIFATIHESYYIFRYYLWTLLYYFN